MRQALPNTLLAALAIPFGVYGLSLSDWEPYATGLTPQCNAIYHETIPGCSTSDFGPRRTCSSSCIQGFVTVSNAVYQNCGSNAQNNQKLIGVFLSGQGISKLCPGVAVSTAGDPAPASSAPPPSSAPASSQQPDPTSSEAYSSSAATTSSATSSVHHTSTTLKSTSQRASLKSISTSSRTSSFHSTSTGKSISTMITTTQSSISTNIIGGSPTPTPTPTPTTSLPLAAPASSTAAPVNECTDNGSPFGGGGCSSASHSTLNLWLSLLSVALASCALAV